LFVGWLPDAAGRGRLAGVVAGVRDAWPAALPAFKPRRPEQWHATLCFIGHDCGDAVMAAAARALAPVAAIVPPHALALERIAYWEGPGVIVALPAPNPTLQALCDECARGLSRAGIPRLQATTQPHITLAYTGRHLRPQPWLHGIDCDGPSLQVERFQLLSNPGGSYETLGDWPLAGEALDAPPARTGLS
jgi:2'-5' RNA ligase